jgi:hypothetical protein
MPVDLQTIEGVPLVSTGTYSLASGKATFTEEDLAAAVAAAADATVPSPRIKIGHNDPRFADAIASGELDGEPAFGTIENLRLSDDRQTVIGDYTSVPAWLADSMESAFPGRSIEGGFGFEAPSGRSYEFVISALSLLGATWPGVTSLADLREVLEANGTAPADVGELVEAGANVRSRVMARVRSVAAGLDLDLVRRRFVDHLDSSDFEIPDGSTAGWEWWPRSMRVEDDGTIVIIAEDGRGNLFQVPVTVAGTNVTFGEPVQVVEQYVAASGAHVPETVGAWHTRAAARPNNDREDRQMPDLNLSALRELYGLADDADEAAINAALEAGPPAPSETETEHEHVAPVIPEGMALVDQATLDELREGALAGVAARQAQQQAERERIISAAIREGRIAVARREHFETLFANDPEGTTNLLTADVAAGGLAPGLVPVTAAVGADGDGEGREADVEVEHDAYMQRHFPNVTARRAASGVRTRTEV